MTATMITRLLLAAMVAFSVASCAEDFDPATLVNELRVLGISAEPPDLIPLETTVIDSLVIEPEGGDVEYHWELCVITGSPDEGLPCRNDLLGFDEELLALFELGNAPTASFTYLADGDDLQELCEEALEGLDSVPEFVQLPNCDEGLDVTLRLEVSSGGVSKTAVKSLFLWFDDPGDDERNHNPTIAGINAGGSELAADEAILVAPGGRVRFDVSVDEADRETFVREFEQSDVDDEVVREEILFSFYSTDGEWDQQFTFTEDGRIPLSDAGTNWFYVDSDVAVGERIEAFFIIRDGRGGSDWQQRQIVVAEPSGMQ